MILDQPDPPETDHRDAMRFCIDEIKAVIRNLQDIRDDAIDIGAGNAYEDVCDALGKLKGKFEEQIQ